MTTTATLDAAAVRRALLLRDLTDPDAGPHAMQLLLGAIEATLTDRLSLPVRRRRANPVVTVADNYDRLGYGPDAVARDGRYSRYLTDDLMLRAHTTAAIPAILDELATDTTVRDVVVTVPGLVYRRDVIDREHVGEPHQLDVWRIRRDPPAPTTDDLDTLIDAVVATALPGAEWRACPRRHPYTVAGRQVDVRLGERWLEVGECGLADPGLLGRCGLPDAAGLASGWGLDRLLMLRKGIEDIRILRSRDPRVAAQLLDLAPYEPVSDLPPAIRDVSIAVAVPVDAELLGDRIRAALGADAELVEDVTMLSDTPGADLPPHARARIGLGDGQHNLLLRLTLRPVDRTLTSDEANRLRDRIYAAVHEGSVHQWAAGGPPP